jgi:hypothetical protein
MYHQICDHGSVVTFVKQGLAHLGDSIHMPVQILGFDHDFWFRAREVRGGRPPGAKPLPLGPDGLLFYVCFREPGETIVDNPRVDTEAFATPAEAIAEAERLARARIVWDQ